MEHHFFLRSSPFFPKPQALIGLGSQMPDQQYKFVTKRANFHKFVFNLLKTKGGYQSNTLK